MSSLRQRQRRQLTSNKVGRVVLSGEPEQIRHTIGGSRLPALVFFIVSLVFMECSFVGRSSNKSPNDNRYFQKSWSKLQPTPRIEGTVSATAENHLRTTESTDVDEQKKARTAHFLGGSSSNRTSSGPIILPTTSPEPSSGIFNIAFVSNMKLDSSFSVILNACMASNPNANVFVVTSFKENSATIEEFSNRKGVKFVSYSDLSSQERSLASLQKFNASYLHESTNSIEFEKFCMVRFIILNALVRNEKLSNVFFVDNDLLLLRPLEHIFPNAAQHRLSTLFESSSYWVHFQDVELLEDFAEYIVGFYLNSRAVVVTEMHRCAYNYPNLESKLKERRNVALQNETLLEGKVFSDMSLFRCWVRNVDTEEVHMITNNIMRASNTSLIVSLKFVMEGEACEEKAITDDFARDFRVVGESGGQMPQLHHQDNIVSGIHFQGKCKKILEKVLNVVPDLKAYLISHGEWLSNAKQ